VSIRLQYRPNLTAWPPGPDVGLGYTSTGQQKPWRCGPFSSDPRGGRSPRSRRWSPACALSDKASGKNVDRPKLRELLDDPVHDFGAPPSALSAPADPTGRT
jgi:hypothetical protein